MPHRRPAPLCGCRGQILGLQQGKDYSDPAAYRGLRYGHLMIMTDQDHDGSHIKGLIINFIHCYWPALLKQHDFVREFVTPIVKVSKARQSLSFFTLKEYSDWRLAQAAASRHLLRDPFHDPRALRRDLRQTSPAPAPVPHRRPAALLAQAAPSSWNVKYYKGLGTSTSQEAKQYFSNLPLHELTFTWSGPSDAAKIERAFSKTMADQRKEWLRAYDPAAHVDHSAVRAAAPRRGPAHP